MENILISSVFGFEISEKEIINMCLESEFEKDNFKSYLKTDLVCHKTKPNCYVIGKTFNGTVGDNYLETNLEELDKVIKKMEIVVKTFQYKTNNFNYKSKLSLYTFLGKNVNEVK